MKYEESVSVSNMSPRKQNSVSETSSSKTEIKDIKKDEKHAQKVLKQIKVPVIPKLNKTHFKKWNAQ